MKITQSDLVKGFWHNFFCYEERFLEWVNQNTEVITSLEQDDLLSYRSIYDTQGQAVQGHTKAPQAFRHVCFLRNADDANELLERIRELKRVYLLPVLTEAKEMKLSQSEIDELMGRLPNRFPEYYSGIDQINISINDAYSSKRITQDTKERLTIKTYLLTDKNNFSEIKAEAEKDRSVLVRFGLNSASVNSERIKVGVIKLDIDASELVRISKAESLQLRVHTGDQYRARLFEQSGTTSLVRFGLIILDAHCSIHHVLPRPQRSISLQKIGRQFELPISSCSNFSIWINDWMEGSEVK